MQVFDSYEKANKNKRRYDPIFDVYKQMNGRKRRPKMEGIDVVVLDDDKTAGKWRHCNALNIRDIELKKW